MIVDGCAAYERIIKIAEKLECAHDMIDVADGEISRLRGLMFEVGACGGMEDRNIGDCEKEPACFWFEQGMCRVDGRMMD